MSHVFSTIGHDARPTLFFAECEFCCALFPTEIVQEHIKVTHECEDDQTLMKRRLFVCRDVSDLFGNDTLRSDAIKAEIGGNVVGEHDAFEGAQGLVSLDEQDVGMFDYSANDVDADAGMSDSGGGSDAPGPPILSKADDRSSDSDYKPAGPRSKKRKHKRSRQHGPLAASTSTSDPFTLLARASYVPKNFEWDETRPKPTAGNSTLIQHGYKPEKLEHADRYQEFFFIDEEAWRIEDLKKLLLEHHMYGPIIQENFTPEKEANEPGQFKRARLAIQRYAGSLLVETCERKMKPSIRERARLAFALWLMFPWYGHDENDLSKLPFLIWYDPVRYKGHLAERLKNVSRSGSYRMPIEVADFIEDNDDEPLMSRRALRTDLTVENCTLLAHGYDPMALKEGYSDYFFGDDEAYRRKDLEKLLFKHGKYGEKIRAYFTADAEKNYPNEFKLARLAVQRYSGSLLLETCEKRYDPTMMERARLAFTLWLMFPWFQHDPNDKTVLPYINWYDPVKNSGPVRNRINNYRRSCKGTAPARDKAKREHDHYWA